MVMNGNCRDNQLDTELEWQDKFHGQPMPRGKKKEEETVEGLIDKHALDLTINKAEVGTKNPTAYSFKEPTMERKP